MESSQSEIFETVKNVLCIFSYECKSCSEVIKMIYTNKTHEALGYIDILSDTTLPVLTIDNYPNDSNKDFKKELIDLLNKFFSLKKLETTEIPRGLSSITREKFENLELKNF